MQEDKEQKIVDEEDVGTVDVDSTEINKYAPSRGRKSLSKLGRQLNDEELKESGVQKLLLDIIEETEKNRDELKKFERMYYESNKNESVLAEKLKVNITIDTFYGLGIGIGGTILGLSTSIISENSAIGIITLILGAALIFGSIFGRGKKNES